MHLIEVSEWLARRHYRSMQGLRVFRQAYSSDPITYVYPGSACLSLFNRDRHREGPVTVTEGVDLVELWHAVS